MPARAWLTPDQLPAQITARAICLPDDQDWLACFRGALLLLADAGNWEQFGSLTPDETASVWMDVFVSFIEGSCIMPDTTPIGAVIMWAGGQANIPTGYLSCDGTAYNTSQYPDLFAVIGTTYGGGGTAFQVPNLQDRFPVGAGSNAPGVTGGENTHTLTINEMPSHTHYANGSSVGASAATYRNGSATIDQQKAVDFTGGGAAHENRPPFLTMMFLIRAE